MLDAFADQVRDYRSRAGLSQRALSALLAGQGFELDPTGLSRIESGERRPRLDEAVALSKALRFEIPGLYRDDASENERLREQLRQIKAIITEQED